MKNNVSIPHDNKDMEPNDYLTVFRASPNDLFTVAVIVNAEPKLKWVRAGTGACPYVG